MNIETLRDYCLSLNGTEEKLPFGDNILVFYIRGKMFCLADIDLFESINLKCDPEKAVILREEYGDVGPGYHMNKKHWNTIRMTGRIPDRLLREWIRESYELVVAGLPKKVQQELAGREAQSRKKG